MVCHLSKHGYYMQKEEWSFGTIESVLVQKFPFFFLTTILLEFSWDFFAAVLQ
jgi:hypothetical protein